MVESQSTLQLKPDTLHREVQRMGVFPNLEILDYTCESRNKSKCSVFPVYLVFHLIYLKGKWWEGRKGKKCSPCFGTLTSSCTTSRITCNSSPITTHAFPGPKTVCSDSLWCFSQGWSLQVMLNSEETTTYHPWVGCSQIPCNDTLLIPITGLLVKAWSPGWNA